MSRFTKELRVIPTAAWMVGWIIYACITVPTFLFVIPTDPTLGKWPRWGQALFVLGIFLFAVALAGLIGYIYGDARRRHMRYIMWTLLAIFMPNAIGIMLYFILRDPLWKPCPGCGNFAKAGFAFCPHCGASLQPTCPNCGKPIDSSWANCAHCGQRLSMPAPRATQNQGLPT